MFYLKGYLGSQKKVYDTSNWVTILIIIIFCRFKFAMVKLTPMIKDVSKFEYNSRVNSTLACFCVHHL